jgi:hypothetical protein
MFSDDHKQTGGFLSSSISAEYKNHISTLMPLYSEEMRLLK